MVHGWAPKKSSTNRLYDYILSYLHTNTTLCVSCLKAASNNHIIVSILYFDGNQQEGSDLDNWVPLAKGSFDLKEDEGIPIYDLIRHIVQHWQ